MQYTFVFSDGSKITEIFDTKKEAVNYAFSCGDHLYGWYPESLDQEIANLRHLFSHLVNGTFKDSAELGEGLLYPVIAKLELRNV